MSKISAGTRTNSQDAGITSPELLRSLFPQSSTTAPGQAGTAERHHKAISAAGFASRKEETSGRQRQRPTCTPEFKRVTLNQPPNHSRIQKTATGMDKAEEQGKAESTACVGRTAGALRRRYRASPHHGGSQTRSQQ